MRSTQGFNVFIADDPLSVVGLASLFGDRVCGTATDGSEAIERLLAGDAPSIALLGACLPNVSAPLIVKRLYEAESAVRPIIISCSCHSIDFVEAVSHGLMGFVNRRSIDEIKRVVAKVAEGDTMLESVLPSLVGALRKDKPCKLTKREHEILVHMASGKTTKQIAAEIFIAEPTTKFHIRNIYSKLDVHNKGAAIHEAMRQGLID